MPTNNAWNSENPAQVARGGTGSTTLSDGFVLLGSGTDAVTALDVTAKGSILVGDGATDPVALAVGTNNQVLTADSGEASGMKWTAAPGAGGTGAWIFISSQTASASATIEFTGLSSTHFIYAVYIDELIPSSNQVNFRMRTSTDNGTSFDASSSNYRWGNWNLEFGNASEGEGSGSQGDTLMRLHKNSMGNATNEENSFRIFIFNPSATTETRINWDGIFHEHVNNNHFSITGAGVRQSAADVDAIQFSMSSGNIAGGIFKLYGLLAS